MPHLRFVLSLFLVAGYSSCVRSADPSETKHVRVLAIGNSFTRNATNYLDDLAEAAGYRLSLKKLDIGGSPLELHASKAAAFEVDRQDNSAKYSVGESLQEALMSEEWDFVTIQQLSIKSHDVTTYRPYASQLADIIHRYAPQAQLLVHQTWAYRIDDPRFRKASPKPGEPKTQAEMYRGISKSYSTIVEELAAKRIPVGDAFWAADNDADFGFKARPFDTSSANQLPDQTHSLHVGYRWRSVKGERVIQMDGHHANLAGEYLGACVWFDCLFDANVIGNDFIPTGLDKSYASFLQTTAHQAANQGGDIVRGVQDQSQAMVKDATPQRYTLTARASEIDQRTKEYPEINFTFGTAKKPADKEYASVDTRVDPKGKLMIWLMGYNSGLFERLNAEGIHTIGVSYARGWFGKLCRPQPSDAFARGQVRLEAATGQDFSDELDLETPDGAAERARQFLLWLVRENPEGNWDQFLADDGSRIRWDKVIISGASHGSTTAARFAKHQRVDRVVMLCGPRDQDQDWQALPSATPANRFFGFTHVLDGGWTGDHYCRSWELLGLHQYGPIVNIDETQPPYENSRRLITDADVGGDAGRAHSSVTPGGSSPKDDQGDLIFDPVWKYLYTHPVDQVGDPVEEDADCERVHVEYN
ncbi:DUF4886 domain-containing protein [Stieleria sp. JC731]|uniref:BPSS1187 family protein n=1 Tax=Pirellulaceae TaxID=2691357 RepID=UPI001E54CF05|nr:DUF4886 domain-containing protein [Stieleria sp. JC731]MCC9602733.1 DUF4886 domain-containing protein [Stieleria sp. JC731]